MNHDNDRLMDLAKAYIVELPKESIVSAFAGGSVGRGEADRYSDLDLNIYMADETTHYSKNVHYNGEVIQVHIHQVPAIDSIYHSPWDFRFLKEARTVYDPEGRFKTLQNEAIQYFDSMDGRQKMFKQAKEIVEDRQQRATDSIKKGYANSATIAARAAWTDAAYMYTYFIHNSMSDGKLLVYMRELELYDTFRSLVFDNLEGKEIKEKLEILHCYRKYLFAQAPDEFALSPIQDELSTHKVERLLNWNDKESILWLLYGEAFWFYLSAAGGMNFEEHLETLSDSLREGLSELGFNEMEREKMEELCRLSDLVMGEIEL
jgi:predicted nucleotidyltransferase